MSIETELLRSAALCVFYKLYDTAAAPRLTSLGGHGTARTEAARVSFRR